MGNEGGTAHCAGNRNDFDSHIFIYMGVEVNMDKEIKNLQQIWKMYL